ncbi:class F sortase [Streptomyces bambusae]|uniref:class F sortase n=1 Tax=Streptomyces bambusae TaxID=1550616 RepID=UPI001CFD1CA6|nr:class F sortase [Streptomyces bambusae]MCB5164637.1 class F sortase [Streptomyces bambusae]
MSTPHTPPAGPPAGGDTRPADRRRTFRIWACSVLALAAVSAAGLGAFHHFRPTPGTSAASPATAPARSPGTPPALAPSPPERIVIPAIGVDSPVTRLGLAADGTVQVPPITPDSPVGWYRHSATPGAVGASVLLGHVTVGRYGDGVFAHLDRLRPGAQIRVTRADGTTAVFTVTRTALYPKSRFPARAVYGATSTPQLRLVTCAHRAGPPGSGYLDNLVDYAVLTSVSS